MNKFSICVLSALGTAMVFSPLIAHAEDAPAATQAPAKVAGRMLSSQDGARLGSVLHVTGRGTAEIIYNGRLIGVPLATLSEADGKLRTSLTKKQVTQLP